MRKIKRFKIATRQKEILRKLLRTGDLLRRAEFTSEPEVARFVLDIAKRLDPGTVYEFNQDAHWELENEGLLYREMFSACAVTLGADVETYLNTLKNEARLVLANTVVWEFLRTATLFVTDLVKEQAQAEECETLDMQLAYLPSFGLAAEPKLFREAPRLEKEVAQRALPVILEKLNAAKIDVTLTDGVISPQATVVFLVPWQKKKKKGKK